MIKSIILIVAGLSLFSCKNNFDRNNDLTGSGQNTIPVISIDFNEVKSNLVEKLSDVYEPIEIICLETNKESLLSSISNIQFYDDNFYILNTYPSYELKVFSKNRTFIYRIGRMGNGPGEYNRPIDFEISNQKIRILEINKIIEYDMNGIFLREVPLDFNVQGFTGVSQNYDVFYGDSQEDRIIISDKNGHKIKSYYNYSGKNNASTPWLIQTMDSTAFINIPLCDTVFAFKNDSLFPFCKIDFGSSAFTNKDYENLSEESKKAPFTYIPFNEKYVINSMYMESQDYQYLLMMNGTRYINGIISKQSDMRLYYNVMDCEDDLWYSGVAALPMLTFDNNKVIFVQLPANVLKGWKYLKEKSKSSKLSEQEQVVLEQMNRVCKNLDEMSNPLIFIAKIKI